MGRAEGAGAADWGVRGEVRSPRMRALVARTVERAGDFEAEREGERVAGLCGLALAIRAP